MVAWWPFSRGGGGASSSSSPSTNEIAVPPVRGVQETESFANVASGRERNFGDSGVGQSEVDRMRDMQKVRRHGDGRVGVMDTESIDCLVDRFESAFRAADAHMKQREANESSLKLYDYEGDRRYQQWREDQNQVRERLQIHYLDRVLDEPYTCLIYYMRVCTTAGLCYGVGRTAYLYRTMDKTYAKLNGVSLGGIAFNEISSSVAKSAFVAMAGCAGFTMGESFTGLCRTLWSGDISQPERSWVSVTGAGASSGLCAGAAYVGMHYKDLTPWGMRAMLGGFTTLGTLVGLYFGYCVYRPFAEQRSHALYDPYWRPWQTRNIRLQGPTQVRGKYY